MTKGIGRRDQKHFINICQKHKIRKKIFELQETQKVKKKSSFSLRTGGREEIKSDFRL